MGLFLPLRRATLLIPSGPEGDQDRKHLFILLTDPADADGKKCVLLVSISSVREGVPHDATCILHPGDHPFVKRASFVVYQRARIETADKLLRGVKSGELVPQDPMESGVFARVFMGLEESRLTPPRVLRFYLEATGQT